MIVETLGAFLVWKIFFGGGKKKNGAGNGVATTAANAPAGPPEAPPTATTQTPAAITPAASADATAPVFPAALPSTLPAFPGSGWCDDEPMTDEAVKTRAGQLMTTLWAQGAGSHVTELTAGRWITYAAEADSDTKQKGVHIYRTINCPPLKSQATATTAQTQATAQAQAKAAPAIEMPAPAPAPTPVSPGATQVVIAPTDGTPAIQVPAAAPAAPPTTTTDTTTTTTAPTPTPTTPLQLAAVAMNNALNARLADGSGNGAYRSSDAGIYKAFQSAGTIKSDGFPGKGTMTLLASVLQPLNIPLAAVPMPFYPWKAKPGWGGTNAPTLAQWNA